MNRSCKGILLVVLVAFWGSFLSQSVEVGAKEKVLVIADFSPVPSLDPITGGSAQAVMLFRNLYQGLVQYKFNSAEFEGDLAKSWTISKDGLVYTFKLRDDVKWHKGFGKVTALDVKFSFDRVMDPQSRFPGRGSLEKEVREVTMVDEYTVEVHLKQRNVPFLHRMARPILPIWSQKAIKEYGKDHARNPIGSGPFVFQSMTREEIVLIANKEYCEGPPRIDKVVYKTIPDVDTSVMALQKGEIDLIWAPPRDRGVFDRLEASGIKIKSINRGTGHYMLLNHQFKPLSDVRVRRAIAHAIDRDTIATHVLGGTAEKWNSLVPKGSFGHTEEGLRRYDYDPKKARELLAEAGYPNGFEATLDTMTSPNYLPIATALQGQLEKVGIKLKLEVTDQPAWLKKVYAGTTLMTIIMPSRAPDADFPLDFFHTAGFSPGINVARYNKLDKEINEARGEADQAKRLKMYHEIQKKLMEDLPGIPLLMMPFPHPHRPHIAGLPDLEPVWGFDFYRIHFVEKK